LRCVLDAFSVTPAVLVEGNAVVESLELGEEAGYFIQVSLSL